jgi:ATP-dependent protease HslVU (ClpYQ) ATPase subunit
VLDYFAVFIYLIDLVTMFSKKPSAKEAVQESKKEVRKSQREIDREIRHLELEEKKLLIQIKQRSRQPGVKGSDDPGLKSIAKNIVQLRQQRDKLFQAKAQLGKEDNYRRRIYHSMSALVRSHLSCYRF